MNYTTDDLHKRGMAEMAYKRDLAEQTARAEAAEAERDALREQLAAQEWRPLGGAIPGGEILLRCVARVARDGNVEHAAHGKFLTQWSMAARWEWQPLPGPLPSGYPAYLPFQADGESYP